jgi:hypothetical protein
MDMDTFFSETNIASLQHLALGGITVTDRTALFQVLSKRFISAQKFSKTWEAPVRATREARSHAIPPAGVTVSHALLD